MLSLPPTVRVYLAAGVTDMRKAIDGLAALTRNVLDQDPTSGHLFVFCNRRRDRIKILYWEGSGFWLLHKRLEKGTFAWPSATSSGVDRIEMTSAELSALLGGLDLRGSRKRRWYRKPNETLRDPSPSTGQHGRRDESGRTAGRASTAAG
jgi:transposase